MIKPKQHLKKIYRTLSFDEPTRHFKKRLDRNERNQPFLMSLLTELGKILTKN